jgi:HEAT repeat protein
MKIHLHTILFAAITMPALAIPASAQKPAPTSASSTQPDDELKMIALNSLMNADPDRGVPLLEGVLKSSNTPRVKDRAMMILAQTKSPQAQQILTDYAKSGADPDLQLRAVRYIGRLGNKDTQQQLTGIYATASDANVKREIIHSLAASNASDSLLALARTEKDQNLRNQAIRDLAVSDATPSGTLTSYYASAPDASAKKEVISALTARGDAKSVVALARTETDPAIKATIVQYLSSMHKNKDAMDYMMEILK